VVLAATKRGRISGSEASVSSFTRYMATWRGRTTFCVLLFSLSCDGFDLETLGNRFQNCINGDLTVLHVNDVPQNLLRHLQTDRRSRVSEE